MLPLDREKKSSYRVIIEVSDDGQPPQSVTRVLHINVLDIDDHKPRFNREIVSHFSSTSIHPICSAIIFCSQESRPLELSILEEQPTDSVVGTITAIDEDIGENGAIDFMFIDGNQENIFKIVRFDNNSAQIIARQRLDREKIASYLLTVKCFKHGTSHSAIARKNYDPREPSEMQILIKVVDIDDHLPDFVERNPSFGVRLNAPIDYPLITVNAIDKDADALLITYQMVNITFMPLFYKRDNATIDGVNDVFILNNMTGEIRTAKSLADFVDGFFEILIRANNSAFVARVRHNKVKIYVIRDKSLLRFVFAKPPAEVKDFIDEFERTVQSKLKANELEMNILDTKVLMKSDLSFDFSSTSSCFQLSRHGSVLPPNEMQTIMDSEDVKRELLETYAKYAVSIIDSCSVRRNVSAASVMASPGTWLVILAGVVGIFALVSTCTACCLARK